MDLNLPPHPAYLKRPAYFHAMAKAWREHLLAIKANCKPRRHCFAVYPQWKARSCEEEGCTGCHPYADWTPYPRQAEICRSQARNTVMSGSTRCGKSVMGAMLDVHSCVLIPPLWFLEPERVPLLPYLPFPKSTKMLPLITMVVAPKRQPLEKSVVKYIREMVADTPWLTGDIVEATDSKKQRYTVKIPLLHGDIEFMVQDQGIEAFMSQTINVLHEDEELCDGEGEGVRNEAFSRLTDRNGIYRGFFSPIDSAGKGGDTWMNHAILEPGVAGDLDPMEWAVFEVSIHDNKHMAPNARHAHDLRYRDQLTGEPGPEYNVRVLGKLAGQNLLPVLQQGALDWMLSRAKAPELIGSLVDETKWEAVRGNANWLPSPGDSDPDVRFEPSADGRLSVWKLPVGGHAYTVGVDVGHGVPNGNPSAAWAYDRSTGEFVSLLFGLIDPNRFKIDIWRLAHWYNEAWLCVEANENGRSVLTWLCGTDIGRVRYEKLYTHMRPGVRAGLQRMEPGFPMSAESKPFAYDVLNSALSARILGEPQSIPVRIPDADTLREMKSIRRDEKSGKIIAPKFLRGGMEIHGDRTVAAMLALVADRSATCPVGSASRIPRRLHADQATAAMQRRIRQIEADLESERQAGEGGQAWEVDTSSLAPLKIDDEQLHAEW